MVEKRRDLHYQLISRYNVKFHSANILQTDGFLVSGFAPRKKSIIDCSLGQFTEDAGRSLDGDLRWRSLDFIDVLCASFLEDLEARLDVQA